MEYPEYASSELVIDLKVLQDNAQIIRKNLTKGCGLVGVVKADAYGHGAIEIAKALEEYTEILGVARVDEGIALRKAGIKKSILVFTAPTLATVPAYKEWDLIASLGQFTDADILEEGTECHLVLDTGMGRLGFGPQDIAALKDCLAEMRNKLKLSAVYSHFSMADTMMLNHSFEQYKRFESMIEELGITDLERHMTNSAAIKSMPAAHYNYSRSGLALYGYKDGDHALMGIKPALTWKTKLAQVRKVQAGWPISYGKTWECPTDGYLAVIPVGYADGISRSLSNRIEFGINGQRYSQVGTITMDHCMIWLDQDDLAIGTEVDILNGTAMNAEKWAQILGTIPYEITTAITNRVHRTYLY